MSRLAKTKTERTEPAAVAEQHQIHRPPANIYETPTAYFVVADMPGVDPKAIDVRLEREQLNIGGYAEIDGLDPVHYQRTFRVVRGLKPDDVKADYSQGVLTIELPKPSELQPRKITVTAG